MGLSDMKPDSLATISEEDGRLSVGVSKQILIARLWFLLAGFTLTICVIIIFCNRSWSEIIKSWLFLQLILILLSLCVFAIGLYFSVKSIIVGEMFTFDHTSNSVYRNSQWITTLNELQAVQIRRPSGLLSNPYPSVWIVTQQKKSVQVPDTGLLVASLRPGFGGSDIEVIQAQMRIEAANTAQRIAQFAGVPVREVRR